MEFLSHFETENIVYLEEKIFRDLNSKTTQFNNFKDIDMNQIEKIYNLSNNFLNNTNEKLQSKKYTALLKYLSTPYGKNKIISTREISNNTIPTYDEYLAFIITGCDPDCNLFKTFIGADDSLSKREKINLARKTVGFYSKRFMLAEKFYFFKYKKELLTDVKIDKSPYITIARECINNFDDITLERFDNINKLASLFIYSTNEESRYTTCLYNIIYQPNLLNLNNLNEKIVFLISCVDPELNLLTIYEEECKNETIKNRCIKELGFYHKDLIRFENMYKNRFMPDKKISDWSL